MFELPEIKTQQIKWYYRLLFLFVKGEWWGQPDDEYRVYVKRWKNIIYVLDESKWPR